MKRLIALCISVIFVFVGALTIGVSADAKPTFVVSTAQGKVGDTVKVTVSTKNNSGIVSLKLKVGYDSSVLELTECVGNTDVFDGVVGLTYSPITNNPFVINWLSALSYEDYTANDVIATLSFKIKQGAAVGKSDITVSYKPVDVFNVKEESVAFEVKNGFVDVKGTKNDSAASDDIQNTESANPSVNSSDNNSVSSDDTNINDTDKNQSSNLQNTESASQSVNISDDSSISSDDANIKDTDKNQNSNILENTNSAESGDAKTDSTEQSTNQSSASDESVATNGQSEIENFQETITDDNLANGGNQTLLWVVVISLAVILIITIVVLVIRAKK